MRLKKTNLMRANSFTEMIYKGHLREAKEDKLDESKLLYRDDI